MSRLKSFQECSTLADLASLLGIKPSALSYILYKIPEKDRYTKFTIPKRTGGLRTIQAPNKKLKMVQKRLLELLQDCEKEISDRRKFKKSVSHAFKTGHSISTNAAPHTFRRYVFNIDLENFFPSINFGRVRGYFIKNKDYKLNPRISTIIAQIACHENCLPQGSPCSPIISDLITKTLDSRLVKFSKNNGCEYSRYADDITFSTNLKRFPKKIAKSSLFNSSSWRIESPLLKIIEDSGFKINNSKTRMQYKESRQAVTGLIVNNGVNVPKEYYRQSKAMCFQLLKTGAYFIPNDAYQKTTGKITIKNLKEIFHWLLSCFMSSQRSESNSDDTATEIPERESGSIQQLEGRLSYIYSIKRKEASRGGPQESKKERHLLDKGKSAIEEMTPAYQKIYSDFLFYKNFYAIEKPTLMCEGHTDETYLKCAIPRLSSKFPELIASDKGKIKANLHFYHHTNTTRELLIRAEGTSGQAALILNYKKFRAKISAPQPKSPLIILCDNDSGVDCIIKHLPQHLRTGNALTNKDQDFYHLFEHVYLVLTPRRQQEADSKIEYLFEEKLLKTPIGGKTFNHENSMFNPNTEIGKKEFSEYVRRNQASINFDGFSSLLERIQRVILDYKKKDLS